MYLWHYVHDTVFFDVYAQCYSNIVKVVSPIYYHLFDNLIYVRIYFGIDGTKDELKETDD